KTGAIAGTLPYMAPEQLLGKPADRRSDLYSVGVILYEMATGRLPHEGGVPAALIGEILHRDPPPPSSRNPAISAGLESSILRALEKGPDLRFQSARDFERDLKKTPTTAPPRWHIPWGWTIPLGAISIVSLLLALESGWLRRPWVMGTRGVTESIGVLPLLDLSNYADQDYFADGLTEQ